MHSIHNVRSSIKKIFLFCFLCMIAVSNICRSWLMAVIHFNRSWWINFVFWHLCQGWDQKTISKTQSLKNICPFFQMQPDITISNVSYKLVFRSIKKPKRINSSYATNFYYILYYVMFSDYIFWYIISFRFHLCA